MTEEPAYDPNATGSLSAEEIARLPYRPGVGIVLFNAARLVFVGQRLDMRTAAWQMPQGGINKRETPAEAAFRELKEEVGTDNAEIVGETREWLSYELPQELVPKLWRGRFRGQRQKWFAMRFLGDDSEIDINGPEPEFSEWRWAPFAEVPQHIVPFKRNLYGALISEFAALFAEEPPR